MVHRFALKQRVRLVSSGFSSAKASPDGQYEITQLMPQDNAGMFSYRLQSAGGARVARESDLVEMEPIAAYK